MIIFHLARIGIQQAHPEKALRGGAEGLPVEEVAPASGTLADEKAQGHQVQQGTDSDLLYQAEHRDTHQGTQHTAVNGQTTLPDVQHGNGVIPVHIPGKGAVVGPGAQNGKGGHPQHTVDNIVFLQPELLAPAAGIQHRRNQAAGNDEAVHVDIQGADAEGPDGIDLDSQTGERDFSIFIHQTSSSLGVMTDRVHRSRRTTRVKNARISSGSICR